MNIEKEEQRRVRNSKRANIYLNQKVFTIHILKNETIVFSSCNKLIRKGTLRKGRILKKMNKKRIKSSTM